MLREQIVSTIIPVYNRPGFLTEAVASVLAQTYRPIEIIIIDDGSTDHTAEIADNLANQNPEIIKVIHTANRGTGLAREEGRQMAQGEFMQYLDSDDLLLPRKFEIQVAALRSNPDCGIAYGYTRLIDEHGNILVAPYKWTGKTFRTLFPALLVDRWWNTHTPLWRKSVCDAIGPWSDMRMSEDWEYEGRAGANKVKLIHCKEYLSDTRTHTQIRVTSNSLIPTCIKNTALLILKLYDYALEAGVEQNGIAMKHFSRWAFLVARQASSLEMIDEAKKCLQIAQKAAGKHVHKIDIGLYNAFSNLLGWALMGKLFCYLDRVLKRSPGKSTLKKSYEYASVRGEN